MSVHAWCTPPLFIPWLAGDPASLGREGEGGGREGGIVSCYQEESRCRKQWTPTVATTTLVWLAIVHCWLVSSPFCDVIERRACETFQNYRQHYVISRHAWRRLRNAVSVSGIPLGWGVSIFVRWEPVPYLSEYVCQIWLRSDGRVENRGGYRQTNKGTLQLYIVDRHHFQVLRNFFYWKLDPHPPTRNANKV